MIIGGLVFVAGIVLFYWTTKSPTSISGPLGNSASNQPTEVPAIPPVDLSPPEYEPFPSGPADEIPSIYA